MQRRGLRQLTKSEARLYLSRLTETNIKCSPEERDFLYSFATAGAEAVGQLTKGGDGLSVLAGLSKGTGGIVVHMGDINIRGNADDKTVSQIRREQRSAVDMMLREINRLDR